MNSLKRHIWQLPWGYSESFIIVLGLCIESLIFEFISNKPAPIIDWPINIYLLVLIVAVSISLHFLSKKSEIIRWFSSIPASIGAISYFLMLSLIMAIVPQKTDTNSLFFLYSVTNSWTYYIATAYLLVVLGMVTLRRFSLKNHKNIGFFLNHFGLWVVIACATFGAGDIQKYSMILQEGKTEWIVYSQTKQPVQLDFAIQLKEFSIEEYPAKIAVINKRTGEFLISNRKKTIFEIDTIQGINWNNYHISIIKHLPTAMYYMDDYFPIADIGATQAYYVSVKDSKNKEVKGWIGPSSISQQAVFLDFNDSLALAVLQPEAKKFSSKVRIYQKNGEISDTCIEVNQPIKIQEFKVYQTGYDESMGRWSKTSILEIVKDSWLPFVYFGIFLMIVGSFYIIWFAKKSNSKNHVEEL